jgi:hypothetical protein
VRGASDLNGSEGSPEFALALECCRRAFRGGPHAPPASLHKIDWQSFLQFVRFHRIEGLAWSHLATVQIPGEIADELKSAASAIATNNLLARRDCGTLLQDFEAADVPLVFLKGLTTGVLAYGNPAIKSSIDVDLLIDRRQLDGAAKILRRHGYILVAPADSPGDRVLQRWHKQWKESVWRKQTPRLQIDLHTRVADNRRLLPDVTVHSSRQWVDVGDGLRLPTFGEDELFAYLAVHGASSAWFRLKWIADFAGHLSEIDAESVARLYRRSLDLGAGRAAGQALLLAHELFGTLQHNGTLLEQLRRDAGTRRLYRTALRLLRRNRTEPTEERWGTLSMRASQLLLLPGLSFKFSEASRQLRQAIDSPSA